MKYMLLIYEEEKNWLALTDAERQKIIGEYSDLVSAIAPEGKFLGGEELQPTTTATSVSMRDGRRIVTDGPFAETREQLGGYFVVEAKDLDEAIGIAERIPTARTGTIEIRPVVESNG